MSESKPISIGLVGVGRAGWGMHLGELKSRGHLFRIVAACDVVAERRSRMAAAYGCRTYRTIADLVRDPEVELVDIATRSTEHVEHGLAALASGKHVFMEKPIAVDYAGARTLVAAARKSRGGLYVRHNRRFEPAFQHVREIMASGILGEVYEIKLRRNSFGRRNDWQALLACGGGQLLNWGPHIIDHSLQLLESPVASMWSDLKLVTALGDAEDHLKIIFRGRNGRLVDMEISGGSAIGEPEYLVHGTRGALRSDGTSLYLRRLAPAQKLSRKRASAATPKPGQGFGNPEKLEWMEETIPVAPKLAVNTDMIWDRLYDTIRGGKPFPITLDESLAVMRVVSQVRKGTPFDV